MTKSSVARLCRFVAVTLIIGLPVRYSATRGGYVNRVVSLEPDTLRCVFDLSREADDYSRMDAGYNYEIISGFASEYHCSFKAWPAIDSTDYLSLLKQGDIDILICNRTDSLDLSQVRCTPPTEHGVVWIMRNEEYIREARTWISFVKNGSETSESLRKRFFRTFNPQTRCNRGLYSPVISPYDDIIRIQAKALGWDWRLLAAVIYQESMFSICATSHRGAFGLMQIIPSVAERYNETDLMDPQKNIAIGTKHLTKLQRFFIDLDINPVERSKFTIAAYNAGLGRIEDIRNLATMLDVDNTTWESASSVIPYMRSKDILTEESVKHGTFQGYETINYVESVFLIYEQFVLLSSGKSLNPDSICGINLGDKH